MNRRAFFSVVPALAVAPMVPAVRAVSIGIDGGGADSRATIAAFVNGDLYPPSEEFARLLSSITARR